jgi:hypothetical protein
MSIPFETFQRGLMTGTQLGTQMRERRNSREIGGMMSSGNVQGARDAAYGQGDLRTGQALEGQLQQQATQQRGAQLTGALREGNYDQALSFAQSPEELAQVTEFRNTASEAEKAAAVQRAEQMAMVVGEVMSLPPDQQFAAAQQAAQRMGMDPAAITPDMVTPQALETMRMQALGLKDYLAAEDREARRRQPVSTPYGIIWPEGTTAGQMGGGGGAPEYVDSLPPGVRPRPNQPSAAPAAVGGERSQTPRVAFRSSNEARQSVSRLVPGVSVTNADRTPADTARLRRQGYNPSDTSFHLSGRALDLTPPPGMTMRQLEAKMRDAGFRVLNEGHHIHVSW